VTLNPTNGQDEETSLAMGPALDAGIPLMKEQWFARNPE
jgi:hypothetical protein